MGVGVTDPDLVYFNYSDKSISSLDKLILELENEPDNNIKYSIKLMICFITILLFIIFSLFVTISFICYFLVSGLEYTDNIKIVIYFCIESTLISTITGIIICGVFLIPKCFTKKN